MRVQLEPLELSVQRGAADAKGLRGRRDIAACAQERPLQHCALTAGKMVARGVAAEEIGGGHRLQYPAWRNPECRSGGPGRSDHEIVRIDRNEAATLAVGSLRQHDAGMGEGSAKQIGLDTLGRLTSRERDQTGKHVGTVGAAGGDVEHARERSLMVVDRNGGAAEKGVAGEEMLIAVDRQRPLLDETGTDAVGVLMLLAPERAGSEVLGLKCR